MSDAKIRPLKTPIKLSVIIVSYNTASETSACIKALQQYGLGKTQEIIVVDNASSDRSPQLLSKMFHDITMIASPDNLGFARGCNLGVKSAGGEYLAFINSDCIAREGALPELVSALDKNQDMSVAVPRLLENDGRIQNNIAKLPKLRGIVRGYILGKIDWYDIGAISQPVVVESFSGAALVIRAADFHQVGGFDETYFMYMEDVELSRKLGLAGKQILYLPDAIMQHEGGGSSHAERPQLNAMMHDNRITYVNRYFSWPANWVAVVSIKLGIAIMRLKLWIKKTALRR